MEKKIGKVAVDSGTLMIGDPCYLENEGWNEKDYQKFVVGMRGDFQQVPNEKAVIFSSGLGDGCYDVFATIEEVEGWGKRVTEVRIKLI